VKQLSFLHWWLHRQN